MSQNELPSGGIIESFRKICDTGLALFQNRLELFGVEVEEQKVRLVRVLCLAGLALILTNTAILVVTATIVVLAGEKAREAVLVVLSLLYLGGAVVAFLVLRREFKSSPPPFSGSISAFKKDREWLDPRH